MLNREKVFCDFCFYFQCDDKLEDNCSHCALCKHFVLNDIKLHKISKLCNLFVHCIMIGLFEKSTAVSCGRKQDFIQTKHTNYQVIFF